MKSLFIDSDNIKIRKGRFGQLIQNKEVQTKLTFGTEKISVTFELFTLAFLNKFNWYFSFSFMKQCRND